jgi:hypothetical protein
MATSGVTLWQLTRDELITAALRKIGVVEEGATPNASQLADGAEALNALLSEFQTFGMPLWKRVEYPLTMISGTETYTIGVSQTTNTPFPLKLTGADLNPAGSGTRISMTIMSRSDFDILPSDSSGTPVNITYQPYINYGVLKVWPIPDNSTDVMYLTYQSPVEVFTTSTETMDFPQEWHNAVIYNLASLLADEYSLPIQDRQWYEKQAEKHLNTVLSFGSEETGILIYPDR